MATVARPARGEIKAPSLPVDPTWYKDAVIYQLHVRSFFDSNNDDRFLRLTAKSTICKTSATFWLLRHRRIRRHYATPGTILPIISRCTPDYGTCATFATSARRGPFPRPCVITECAEPYVGPASVVPARRAKPNSPVRLLCVERHAGEIRRRPIIFKDFETSNWPGTR